MCDIFTGGCIGNGFRHLFLAMKGSKWSTFSSFLIQIQKPKFKSEWLFVVSSIWFNLKGVYCSFPPIK